MRSFVSFKLLVFALTAGLLCATAGYADTFSWSISGTGISGSGTFTATNEGDGEYLATAMTGTLTVGATTGAITGLTPYTGTLGTYGVDPSGLYNFDDVLSPKSTPEVDGWGVVFSVAGFSNPLNLCAGTNCGASGSQYLLWDNGVAGPGNTSGFSSTYNSYSVTFSDADLTTSAPEPSTMGLLSLGLIGLMLALRREWLRAS